jgi:uncharacterized protein YbbC (DUF1343 family)
MHRTHAVSIAAVVLAIYMAGCAAAGKPPDMRTEETPERVTEAVAADLPADTANGLPAESAVAAKVVTGIERLKRSGFGLLEGKRVGLITNATGVDDDLVSTVDLLYAAENVELVALFGPEHGVRGDYTAGEYVESYTDEKTGLPVYSLYGRTRKPTPEMLEGLDVLVYDIQDIGVRSYTYISTMGLAMEAAAENDLQFIVLDRPNPLGGLKIEGNIAEAEYRSFVSAFPIPYVYGLTTGELARMINNEGWLTDGVRCDLYVLPMEGWNRDMTFAETGLPWVPTSPHIPHHDTPLYYVATGILGELYTINIGVGYTTPFRTFAAEWIDAQDLTTRLRVLELDGVRFRPVTYRPYYGSARDKTLHGVHIYITDTQAVQLMSLQFLFMQAHHDLYPDRNPFDVAPDRLHMFDRVLGTSEIRAAFTKRMRYDDIEPILNRDVESFREMAETYYMYYLSSGFVTDQ